MPTIDTTSDPFRYVVEIPPGHRLVVDGLELATLAQERGIHDDTPTRDIAAVIREVATIEGDGALPDYRVVAAALKVLDAVEAAGNGRGRRPSSPPHTE